MRVFLSLIVIAVAAPALAAPPKVTSLYPAGLARGSEVQITAAGDVAKWPPQVWIDRPGLSVKPAEKKGELTVKAEADAQPGIYQVRLYDAEGASAVKTLVVGTSAEVNDKEPNNDLKDAQQVSLPVVANGKLSSASTGGSDVDLFEVSLAAGETLVAALMANDTLGSPMDAAMQIVTPQGAIVAQNHDVVGLDPRIVYTAPTAGKYLVQLFAFPAVPNSKVGISASDDYVYRLTLAKSGFVDFALPLAVTCGQATSVELQGPGIPAELRTLTVNPTADQEMLTLFQPQLPGLARVAVAPIPVLNSIEPNDAEHSQPLEVPAVISGRLEQPGDLDSFLFRAEAKQRLTFRAEALALGLPTDIALKVIHSEGAKITELDDTTRDSIDVSLLFTTPSTGQYRLEVRDLYGRGGERFAYRIFATSVELTYTLSATGADFTVSPGKTVEIPVKIDRQAGLNDAIEISALELPEGVTAEPVKSEGKGDTAKAVKLVLNAGDKAVSGAIRIGGKVVGETTSRMTNSQVRNLWLTVK